ncbi:adenosine 5'-monophosphoramidase HINT3 isoform X2 [Gouania willdenowi]|uniref:adenosine 5'-monophosphoramidase HINT3 isoform X2 n=1 Tax=Gouania willdenowi TaxID=441366 RepID=UPI0010541887|nr:histidine triad nucleotide-binding protein 3 isoform X2 [Gouania willdenowi]
MAAAQTAQTVPPVDVVSTAGRSSTEAYDKKCIFCRIVNNEMGTELLHSVRLIYNTVNRMVEAGKEILRKNNVSDFSDVRFGFHWPPFCSVTHLHLHVLAPASQMGFLSRLMYRLNSYWFITADQLIELLNCKGETN